MNEERMDTETSATDQDGPGARGNWSQTFTGVQFYPLDPRPEDIDIRDIAHALSQTCRYGGHTRVFYSVAEHCIHLAHAMREMGPDPAEALQALMHDAAEAYCQDLVRPIKEQVQGYAAMEGRIERAIQERFGLRWAGQSPGSKVLDNLILYDEGRALMRDHSWYERFSPGLGTYGIIIQGMSPVQAELTFLDLFDGLMERI
jgi:hypothetical protein